MFSPKIANGGMLRITQCAHSSGRLPAAPQAATAPQSCAMRTAMTARERLAQRERVGDHRARMDVMAVGRELGRCEPAVERGDGAVPGACELGQQKPVR